MPDKTAAQIKNIDINSILKYDLFMFNNAENLITTIFS